MRCWLASQSYIELESNALTFPNHFQSPDGFCDRRAVPYSSRVRNMIRRLTMVTAHVLEDGTPASRTPAGVSTCACACERTLTALIKTQQRSVPKRPSIESFASATPACFQSTIPNLHIFDHTTLNSQVPSPDHEAPASRHADLYALSRGIRQPADKLLCVVDTIPKHTRYPSPRVVSMTAR
jgi:hypothetical protein